MVRFTPYAEGGRVALDGAELQLPSGLGMTLGMSVHELTTNAVKHGALSEAHGRIAVRWRLEERDGAARLLFSWTESGGPSVCRPLHRGFGSQLLEKMLARQFDASVDQTWDPTGLRVDIDAAFGA